MTSAKLSYRLAPVYAAISLALAVPYANADYDKNKRAYDSVATDYRINFDFAGARNNSANDWALSEWSPHFSITRNNIVNATLNNYADRVINHKLAMNADDMPAVSKRVLNIFNKAESNAKQESTLVINGNPQVVMHAAFGPAINLSANKIIIKTTGSESKGIYYVDLNSIDKQPTDIKTNSVLSGAIAALASVENKMNVDADSANRSVTSLNAFVDIDVTPQSSLKLANVNAVANNRHSGKIQISDDSVQAVTAFNEDSGLVTIYNSGRFDSEIGFSPLVYSGAQSVMIANTLGSEAVTGVYARLLANENISIQNETTIIGEFNVADKSAYISGLNIYNQEPIASFEALNNAAAIGKSYAYDNDAAAKQTEDSSAVAMQNLNFITNKDNKIVATKLFNKLTNIDKPSAIQVGFQVKESILSGLEKSTDEFEGMINIRADKNSVGQRVELRGNYYIVNNAPYVDPQQNDDGSAITGNVTIYDVNSTKVYVNNTTIYFDGKQAAGGIDVVDIGENSAGLGSLELSHIISASQYKLYDRSQVTNNNSVSLVSFNNGPLKAKKGDKPKLGA